MNSSLSLRKETLRTLSQEEAGQVDGGITPALPWIIASSEACAGGLLALGGALYAWTNS